jgi:hypothetical protein
MKDDYLRAWRQTWATFWPSSTQSRPGAARLSCRQLMVLPDRGDLGPARFPGCAGGPSLPTTFVSLLQDARRDVAPELEEAMIARYVEAAKRRRSRPLPRPITRSSEPSGQQDHRYLHPASGGATARLIICRCSPVSGTIWGRNLAHPALAPCTRLVRRQCAGGQEDAAGEWGGRGVRPLQEAVALRPNPGRNVPESRWSWRGAWEEECARSPPPGPSR